VTLAAPRGVQLPSPCGVRLGDKSTRRALKAPGISARARATARIISRHTWLGTSHPRHPLRRARWCASARRPPARQRSTARAADATVSSPFETASGSTRCPAAATYSSPAEAATASSSSSAWRSTPATAGRTTRSARGPLGRRPTYVGPVQGVRSWPRRRGRVDRTGRNWSMTVNRFGGTPRCFVDASAGRRACRAAARAGRGRAVRRHAGPG
jgi:hypothetical protein